MAIRKSITIGRAEADALWARLASLNLLANFSTRSAPGIADGTTAGKLKTTATTAFTIAGRSYSKNATDDLWDLSGETDTGEDVYRAYWLLLNTSGAASIAAGPDAASEEEALRRLPLLDGTKSIIGAFVAGPETDFDDAGGLEAQGTVHDGIPDGANIGVPRQVYAAPEPIVLL